MILLNPGPVNVSARVTAALSRGDLCHREPECVELLARIPHDVVASPWTSPADPDAVEAALGAPGVEAVAIVHHETTTGLVNPVAEVARRARALGKLVLVDSVSGLAGDPLDLERCDLVAGTGGKCIQGFPGIAFVLVRDDVLALGDALA